MISLPDQASVHLFAFDSPTTALCLRSDFFQRLLSYLTSITYTLLSLHLILVYSQTMAGGTSTTATTKHTGGVGGPTIPLAWAIVSSAISAVVAALVVALIWWIVHRRQKRRQKMELEAARCK